MQWAMQQKMATKGSRDHDTDKDIHPFILGLKEKRDEVLLQDKYWLGAFKNVCYYVKVYQMDYISQWLKIRFLKLNVKATQGQKS